MNVKENYELLDMEVIFFISADVITESSYDGDPQD